jgi:hypothetical protein
MLGPIERRPGDFGHAAVAFDKAVTFFARVHYICHRGKDRAGIGHQVAARLNLEPQLSAVLFRERFKIGFDNLADLVKVGGLFIGHPCDLEAPAQTQRLHFRQLNRYPQRQLGTTVPDVRIGPRADVRVHLRDG